jgi:hypothetical protein
MCNTQHSLKSLCQYGAIMSGFGYDLQFTRSIIQFRLEDLHHARKKQQWGRVARWDLKPMSQISVRTSMGGWKCCICKTNEWEKPVEGMRDKDLPKKDRSQVGNGHELNLTSSSGADWNPQISRRRKLGIRRERHQRKNSCAYLKACLLIDVK